MKNYERRRFVETLDWIHRLPVRQAAGCRFDRMLAAGLIELRTFGF
ncbi:MAG: hypothetical protein LBF59_08720 [Prevotellaceae bacterium]|jgi:hypothetical protein|nr:hypothetical protein [Prevotellaceae bacterium]